MDIAAYIPPISTPESLKEPFNGIDFIDPRFDDAIEVRLPVLFQMRLSLTCRKMLFHG